MYAVTMELKIKYRKPVPLNEDVLVIAELGKNTPRMFEATGKIIDKNGTVLATGEGTYFKLKQLDEAVQKESDSEVLIPDDIKSFDY